VIDDRTAMPHAGVTDCHGRQGKWAPIATLWRWPRVSLPRGNAAVSVAGSRRRAPDREGLGL
jgi:hypothetical protein